MRTTLTLDDEILAVAKSLAEAQGTTVGKVISDLARKALVPSATRKISKMRNGFSLFQFPRKGDAVLVTMETIDRLRNDAE